ncbi:MAG TPA: hypothetical protein VKZ97_10945 [Flavobacteriaceae bacterium]|nr:hypothetical protein [Flavobacteriaceae bacterium]
MEKQFRYHPVLEDLQVNEDGSVVIYQGRELVIREYKLKHHQQSHKSVKVGYRQITIKRLVCECWHGLPPNRSCAARKVDQDGGTHFGNLYWGKAGLTKELAKTHKSYDVIKKTKTKVSLELYKELLKRKQSRELYQALKEHNIGKSAWETAKRNYGKSV